MSLTLTRHRRHPKIPTLVLTLGICILAGCASGGGAAGGSFDVLTGDQIRETKAANLWDALTALRPQWLRARGSSSLVAGMSNEPVVYVQGIRYGEPRSLQSMNVDQVRRVEFLNARDATTRFGTNHSGGALMVDLDR
jgi:TonB-dependent Receptor Plug Domain